MKDNWSRCSPLLELDHATLTALVHPLLPGRRVLAATVITGGLANTLLKLSISGLPEPMVLRLYTRDPVSCQKDADIYALVQGHVPIPELLYADTDGTLIGVPYALMRWINSPTLSRVLKIGSEDDIGAAMFAAGAVLGKLRQWTWSTGGFFGPGLTIRQPLHFNGAELRVYVGNCLFTRGAADRLGQPLADRLWAFVETHAALLDETQDPRVLVHADFNPPNIMVARRGDHWEVAFAGPPLYDVAVLLRHAHQLPPVFAASFLAGLADTGVKLYRGWRQQAKLLDLFNLSEFLTRGLPGDQMARDVGALIERTIKHWDGSAADGLGL